MIAQEPIPLYKTLEDVFGSVEASLPHAQRWNELAAEFELRFGRKPAYIARAPGRVKYVQNVAQKYSCTAADRLTLAP